MTPIIDRSVALRIINSLKDGVPSVDDVQFFSSSSNPLDTTINSDLQEIYRGNYGKIKFLNGSYGEGKTHFLSRVRWKGCSDGYLVSMFAISPRGVALDMMERTFSELMKTLSLKDYSGSGEETAIENAILKWLPRTADPERDIRAMHLDRDLKAALIQMCKHLPQRELYYRELDILNGWFRADTLEKSTLRRFGILNHVNPRNVFDIIKSLGKFFKRIGYKGWIILADEQEIISTLLTTKKRQLTDQNIRIMIDDQGNMDGIYVLFATTDEFFTDPDRGIVSYPALKTRVTSANTLNLPSISEKEMEEIAANMKAICQTAWNVSINLTPPQIRGCVDITLHHRIPSARARTYVKSLIKLMEKLRDGVAGPPEKIFGELYATTFNEIAIEREKAQEEIEG